MDKRANSQPASDRNAPFSGLLARLERETIVNAQVMKAQGDEFERQLETPDLAQTSLDEPLTPELVLVDPDLARRARDQLPTGVPHRRRLKVEQKRAAQEPLFGFVQPAPSADVIDRQRPSRKRLRARGLAVLIAAAAGAVVFLRVEPLRHFSASHDSASAPGATSSSATTLPLPPAAPPTSRRLRPAGHAQSSTPTDKGTKATSRVAPRTATTRAFAWVAVPNATYYLVQFYRGGREIFEARPTSSRMLVPGQWTFKGRRYRLTPGRYQWSVRPGFGRTAEKRYGQAVVRAKLVIQRASG